jgi:hypothetical protein
VLAVSTTSMAPSEHGKVNPYPSLVIKLEPYISRINEVITICL